MVGLLIGVSKLTTGVPILFSNSIAATGPLPVVMLKWCRAVMRISMVFILSALGLSTELNLIAGCCEMAIQRAFPMRVPNVDEVAAKLSWAGAIELCAECAGFDLDKQASSIAGMDKARWSRIKSGQEGIKPDQLVGFMDTCGNDAPLLWLLAQRGYDLHSVRKCETETEKLLRSARDELVRERNERRVLEDALHRIVTGVAANA